MAKTMMGTVDKALSLLRFFSPQRAELGLSELARLSTFDKTTTLRCMTALERNGFVEQDVLSRKYRIGLTPLNLAQVREQSFPVQSVIAPYLDDLANTLGETAHGTLLMGQTPVTAAIGEPDRALFAHVHPSTALPWHATASGVAIAAYLPDDMAETVLAHQEMTAFTANTPINRTQFAQALAACRAEGLSRAPATFEDEITGTAIPIFGPATHPIGAIAIAAVTLRLTPELQAQIDAALRRAGKEITQALGGIHPQAMT